MNQIHGVTIPTTDTARSTQSGQKRPRYWEVDALRGLAVVAMVLYHVLWDLWYLGVLPEIILWDGFWKYFQRATASTFILLAGVSIALRTQRLPSDSEADRTLKREFVMRGLRIFAVGMAISIAVRFSGIGRLDFGILHLLGIAIILAVPFRRRIWTNVVLWLALFMAGGIVQGVNAASVWWAPLGLTPADYRPLDYFPLLPWFGVLLLGIALGNLLYPPTGRRFDLPAISTAFPIPWLRLLGSQSLWIYVLHQPLIWALLYLTGAV